MIEHEYKTRYMVCDGCGDFTEPYESDEFQRMIDEAKNNGWTIAQINGEWKHYCGDCEPDEGGLAAARRKFGLT